MHARANPGEIEAINKAKYYVRVVYSPMSKIRYIFIVGHGRSGTNWLLDLLNASPQTFCKEPDDLVDSPLKPFWPYRGGWRDNLSLFEGGWDKAILDMAKSMGHHDIRIKNPKVYLHEIPRRLGIIRLLCGTRCGKLMQRIIPSLRSGEWPIPWWIGDADKLKDAITVIKTVQTPGWAKFVLQYRPEVPVVHIVRHPGGYINSWLNRYISTTNPDEVADRNRRRLFAISDADPIWKARLGDIASMGMVEAELWYWRYATELIHLNSGKSHNYHLLIYKDLAQNPVPLIKNLYESTGLPWTDEVRIAIDAACRKSSTFIDNWKKELSAEYQELAEAVLRDSPLSKYWL